MIIHQVFFWLRNPASTADRDKVIAGLKTLKGISQIKEIHIGVPAATEQRSVVDSSWHVSELMFFEDLKAEATYQTHPLHQAFIKECSPLWSKVQVYDANDVS